MRLNEFNLKFESIVILELFFMLRFLEKYTTLTKKKTHLNNNTMWMKNNPKN